MNRERVRSPVRGTDRPEGVLENGEHFLNPRAQMKAGELELAGHLAQIFAGGRQGLHAALAPSRALAWEREPPSPTTIPFLIQRVSGARSLRSSTVAVRKHSRSATPPHHTARAA